MSNSRKAHPCELGDKLRRFKSSQPRFTERCKLCCEFCGEIRLVRRQCMIGQDETEHDFASCGCGKNKSQGFIEGDSSEILADTEHRKESCRAHIRSGL